jgi:hypothetical protein
MITGKSGCRPKTLPPNADLGWSASTSLNRLLDVDAGSQAGMGRGFSGNQARVQLWAPGKPGPRSYVQSQEGHPLARMATDGYRALSPSSRPSI